MSRIAAVVRLNWFIAQASAMTELFDVGPSGFEFEISDIPESRESPDPHLVKISVGVQTKAIKAFDDEYGLP